MSGISDNSFLIKNALQQKQAGDLGVDLRGINNLSKDEKIKQFGHIKPMAQPEPKKKKGKK